MNPGFRFVRCWWLPFFKSDWCCSKWNFRWS